MDKTQIQAIYEYLQKGDVDMRKCKYYNKYQWAEPPLEPDDNGTLITEYECKNAKGYFVASCEGKKEFCDLPKKQRKI